MSAPSNPGLRAPSAATPLAGLTTDAPGGAATGLRDSLLDLAARSGIAAPDPTEPGLLANATYVVLSEGDRSTACPLCHTAGPPPGDDRLRPGAGWRCAGCHQTWDMRRLATVAAYSIYVAGRDAAAAGDLLDSAPRVTRAARGAE